MSRNRWRFSKSIIAVGIFGLALGVLAGLTALISGKPALGGSMGLVNDWTHHHVIFSNPGTAAEALAQGRFEQWYRIVNDPRYLMQEKKARYKPPSPIEKKPIHRDWSMNMGAIAASATGTVTTNNATNSSSVTVGPLSLSASPPVAATQTGSISSLPTSSSSKSLKVCRAARFPVSG